MQVSDIANVSMLTGSSLQGACYSDSFTVENHLNHFWAVITAINVVHILPDDSVASLNSYNRQLWSHCVMILFITITGICFKRLFGCKMFCRFCIDENT